MSGDVEVTISNSGNSGADARVDASVPQLIVICVRGQLTTPGLRITLGNLREVTVGRGVRRELSRHEGTAALSVLDHGISRAHPVVHSQPAGWEVADLGSKNGLLVNGRSERGTT